MAAISRSAVGIAGESCLGAFVARSSQLRGARWRRAI